MLAGPPASGSGADGETRTHTACAATPSRWCVYQFHHVGERRGFYFNEAAAERMQRVAQLIRQQTSLGNVARLAALLRGDGGRAIL